MSNPALTHDQQEALTNAVFSYLKGQPISDVRSVFVNICAARQQDAEPSLALVSLNPVAAQQLLTLLHVPTNKQALYINEKTLLVFLTRLHQDGYGHDHLAYLLNLIKKTKYERSIEHQLRSTAFLAMAWGAFLLIRSDFFNHPWLKALRTILRNIPLMGIFFNSASLLLTLKQTFYYGTTNLGHKLTTILFPMLSIGLSLTAYVLWFLAGNMTLSPLATLFFIGSAAVNIAESLFTFFIIKQQPLPKLESLEQTQATLADYERQKNQHQHASHVVLIKLCSAILITAAIAVWCLFPPSFLLTISCITFLTAVRVIKSTFIEQLDDADANALQTSIASIRLLRPKPAMPFAPESTIKKSNAPEKQPAKQADATLDNTKRSTARASFFHHPNTTTEQIYEDNGLHITTGLPA